MTRLLIVITSFIFLDVSTARAEGYGQFPNSRLFCVVAAPANYLSTIQLNGSRSDHKISAFTRELVKGVRQTKADIASLKNQLSHTNSSSRKARIRSKIAAGNKILEILRSTTAFTKSCGTGALNIQAVPTFPGGPFGGGGKR